jgi:hypothetical protein
MRGSFPFSFLLYFITEDEIDRMRKGIPQGRVFFRKWYNGGRIDPKRKGEKR